MCFQPIGIGATAGTVDLGALDLVEDRNNAGFVLLDLVERFVDSGHKGRVARLHLAYLGQALAQGRQRLAPAFAQRRHFHGVVEVDDDVFLGTAQVAQRGAQIGHVGQRLHPLRKQHLQRAAGAVQRNETHRTNDHQQHQRKDRAEVQARTNGKSAQSVHGSPLQILTSTLATQL